jgi:hypothetical protein
LPMNPLAELDHLNLDPATQTQVAAVVQVLLEQTQRDAEILRAKEVELQAKNAEIEQKDFKIQALTLELAHLRRIRYGVKSEALAPLQRDVFEKPGTLICRRSKPKSNSSPMTNPAPLSSSPNARVRAANPCRIICRASSTAMNPNPAPAANAGKTWSRLAKT